MNYVGCYVKLKSDVMNVREKMKIHIYDIHFITITIGFIFGSFTVLTIYVFCR